MLTKCPECELQVSDKAITCPHCGYPLKPGVTPRSPRKDKKRRRLPNGFGQISEIKNRNLRKPFRAMVCVGKTPEGRPISKPLKPDSYFETYNDAYMALVEYNRNPYDLSPAITMAELFKKWSEEYLENKRTHISAWAYCSSLYNMRVMDVRARHIKSCINDGVVITKNKERHPSPNVKKSIKIVFNLMLDYAVEYEIVDRNYARTFELDQSVFKEAESNRKPHMPFTNEEMTALWDNVGKKKYVDIMLIQCYSGWRPQELGLIRLDDVNLQAGTMMGGMKTEAGENRIVPIHSRIFDLVKARYDEAVRIGSEYLLNFMDRYNDKRSFMLTYYRYRVRFNTICKELHFNPDHRPHDGKAHFVTMAKKYNVDEYAIKYIAGHKINDLTERVYTTRDVEWLKTEIEKIK